MASLASGSVDPSSFPNVTFSNGVDHVGGDVVFLPCDATGEPGPLNQRILSALGLDISYLPAQAALQAGYAFRNGPSGMLGFVVSVGGGETAEVLRRNLTAALSDKLIDTVSSIWLPLMGMGYGGLPWSVSQEVILSSLQETGWLQRPSVHIVIAGPDDADPAPEPAVEAVAGSETGAASSPPSESDLGASQDADSADETEPDTPTLVTELHIEMDPATAAAIAFAGALRAGRKGRGGSLSTTLILFALAESQTTAAPPELRADTSAALFAGAVHALARDKFKVAWDGYFTPGFRPAVEWTPPARPPNVTVNVRQVLDQAAALARASNRTEIGVNDLVLALLNLPRGRDRLAVERMGLTMPELLAAYQDARVGQIGTALLNDVASVDDRLGYKRYAAAITSFLLNAQSPPPLSVSIQAPWGAGKSSLMQQIREALDPKAVRTKNKPKPNEKARRLLLKDVLAFLNQEVDPPEPDPAAPRQLWTIWFNAWKYDSSEQVWAGLVDAIVDQVSDRLTPVGRELFLLKLQLARIDDAIVRRKIYDRIVTIWWGQVRRWAIVGVAAAGTLFGLHKTFESLAPADWTIVRWVSWSPYAPLVILALYLARTYFTSREKTRDEPAAFSLSGYLDVPAYDLSLGTIHHIHEDLLRVLKTTPVTLVDGVKKPTPLVIFIDDLDRCSPSKIAAVVEGVSMFLASEDYGCMFVIGMDPQMIAAALEDAHAQVRSHLPRYERTVPLGWRFMDKFIQLPFTIPPSQGDALKPYIAWLSNTAPAAQPAKDPPDDKTPSEPVAGDAPAAGASGTLTPQQTVAATGASPAPAAESLPADVKAQIAFTESREVGRIIQDATDSTSGNPREIKRLANLTRLYLCLRNERRKVEASWRSPSPSQYARWIVLTLRWPDMVRWLQWGADEFAWPQAYSGGDLTTRRLRLLEDAARQCALATDWTNILVVNLNVPGADESDWATDPKLFEFFTHEALLEPEARLSAAAASGFW